MCLICIDFDRGKLTTQEARRAMGEMVTKLDQAHLTELEKKIARAEKANANPAKP